MTRTPHDRSALHLHLLAEALAERNPPHDLTNIIGAAVHPTQVREVEGRTAGATTSIAEAIDRYDAEVVEALCGVVSGTRDVARLVDLMAVHVAVCDCAVHLVDSAAAFAFVGNYDLAREQWRLAGRLLGFESAPARRPAEAPAVQAIVNLFASVDIACTVDRRTDDTLHPLAARAPTNAEVVALHQRAPRFVAREDAARTRGLRTIHVNYAPRPEDDDVVMLAFSVAGEEAP